MSSKGHGDKGDGSPSSLAGGAGPARIEFVDVDQPRNLALDDDHASALVVFTRSGVPVASPMVELPVDATKLKRHADSYHSSSKFESHIQRLRDVADTDLPRISVVLPSIIGRIDELAISLDSMRDLDYPDYEVVLVDNRRRIPLDDPLPGLVDGRPWARVVRESRPGISAARNAGIANSSGDVIAFTDDDVHVDRGWLRALGARFALDASLGAVTGLILPAELESPAQVWFERYYGGFGGDRSFEALTIDSTGSKTSLLRGSTLLARDSDGTRVKQFALYGVGAFGAGANMAFRRTALEMIGGFDVALGAGTPARGGEDLAALIGVLWAGGSMGYEPAAFVHHRHRREYEELVHQLDGYGLGFTAMITSLVWHDQRHLVSILAHAPRASTRLFESVRGRTNGNNRASQSPGLDAVATYPRALNRSELRAYPRGPLAYWRSRRFWRDAVRSSGP
jgi:hypothetical protein